MMSCGSLAAVQPLLISSHIIDVWWLMVGICHVRVSGVAPVLRHVCRLV